MSELSILTEKKWITKSDPDFYDIKSYIRKNREEVFSLYGKFGWNIVIEPNIITLDKRNDTPTDIRNQGIPSFKSKQDYLNLMILLMFVTQPAHNTVFTLEEAIDYLKMIINEEGIAADSTSRQFTYSLYRTLTYMEETHLIERMDGKLKTLLERGGQIPGVLYKNTGLCHHFLKRRKHNKPTSLQNILYQKLYGQTVVTLSPKEFEYLKKNTDQIEADFKQICDEDVELTFDKDYAWINHMEGIHFPNENNRKDWLILRVCRQLKNQETDQLSWKLYRMLLEKVRNEDSIYWTQEMVKWGSRSYENYVTEELKNRNFIWEAGEYLHIHPAIRHMDL